MVLLYAPPKGMISEIECFHKYWNSVSRTPDIPLRPYVTHTLCVIAFSMYDGKIRPFSYIFLNISFIYTNIYIQDYTLEKIHSNLGALLLVSNG